MKNKQKTDISQSTTVSHELFGLIPLFSTTKDGELTIYKILGLPVWIVQRIVNHRYNNVITRHYLFGIPVAETDVEIEDDEPDNEDHEEYFNFNP